MVPSRLLGGRRVRRSRRAPRLYATPARVLLHRPRRSPFVSTGVVTVGTVGTVLVTLEFGFFMVRALVRRGVLGARSVVRVFSRGVPRTGITVRRGVAGLFLGASCSPRGCAGAH